mgnify:CR=1 FL=1
MKDGFSLIEVLIAITLIATVLIFSLDFFIESTRTLKSINGDLTANNLARLKLEEVLGQDYGDLTSSTFQHFKDKEYQNYQYRIVVYQLQPTVKKIIVVVKDLKKVRAKLLTLMAKEN